MPLPQRPDAVIDIAASIDDIGSSEEEEQLRERVSRLEAVHGAHASALLRLPRSCYGARVLGDQGLPVSGCGS